MFMPRPDERETWERLDELLSVLQTRAGEGLDRRAIVVAHTATLFAGIESSPALEDWTIVAETWKVSARWVERVVGIEIDRLVLRILQNRDGCVDCSIVWVRHLIESRVTLSQWAWARDVEALLG